MEDWDSGNVTTSGGGLECVCSVFLPDSNFPADRVQHMQQVTTDLKLEVEIQMNKVSMKQHPVCFSCCLEFLATFRADGHQKRIYNKCIISSRKKK